MSLLALFVRFTLIYIALLVALAVALSVLGVKGNSGFNTAALLGAVMWVCLSFAKKNGRYFSNQEKTRAVLGMLAIDTLLQAIVAFAVAGAAGVGAMLFALAFVGLLHALVIYVFVVLTGKQYAKQVAKGGG